MAGVAVELRGDHLPSLPYLRSMCFLTDLPICFHCAGPRCGRARRRVARDGGPRARASASSRCGSGEVAVGDARRHRAAGLAVVGAVRRTGSAAASSSMSPNDALEPPRRPRAASSRIPGVSRTRPPPGRRCSWRRVVVCRPRASSSRISRTAATSAPASRFSSVDLPTPDEPTNAHGPARPDPLADLVDAAAVDGARPRGPSHRPRPARPRRALGDRRRRSRSAFDRMTTGSAPLSQAAAR